jgi:Oxoglutarate and iron-dependent oxygenase degradation C-term
MPATSWVIWFEGKATCAVVCMQIKEVLSAADKADALGNGQVPSYEAGCRDGWQLCGPCHMQRFLCHQGTSMARPGAVVAVDHGPQAACAVAQWLSRIDVELFRTRAFARWLYLVTDLVATQARSALRRFRPGLDYTVAVGAPDDAPPTLDVTLCFVDEGNEVDTATWASDELGGYQCYMAASDEAPEAAETYRYEVCMLRFMQHRSGKCGPAKALQAVVAQKDVVVCLIFADAGHQLSHAIASSLLAAH